MVAPPAVYVRKIEANDCLDFSGKTVYGDFRDDLVKDGFAIVKGAIPKERAAQYVDKMQTYLEELCVATALRPRITTDIAVPLIAIWVTSGMTPPPSTRTACQSSTRKEVSRPFC
jgi:hypothetical protein